MVVVAQTSIFRHARRSIRNRWYSTGYTLPPVRRSIHHYRQSRLGHSARERHRAKGIHYAPPPSIEYTSPSAESAE